MYEGRFENSEVRLIRTGMGYREIADEFLFGCSAVISTGFCGGLSPDLTAGDIVLSSEVVYVASKTLKAILTGGVKDNIYKRSPVLLIPEPSPYAHALESKLRKLTPEQEGIRVCVGRTVTSEQVLQSGEEKKKVHAYFNAVTVDMEDFFRAAFAQRKQIPVVCARAVLDRADDAVPSIKSMKSLSGVPRLLKNYKKARQSITVFLEYLIGHLMQSD